MANQCTSELNATSLHQALVGCFPSNFQGYVTSLLPLEVYRADTDTVVEVTNTTPFLLEIGQTVCVNSATNNISSAGAPIITSIQFFADNIPITNSIPYNSEFTQNAIQFFINQGIINPSTTTITVNSFTGGGLFVTITINTNIPITESKIIITHFTPVEPETFTAPFVCDITPTRRRKQRRIGAPLIKEYIYVAFPIDMAPIEPVNFMGMDYINPVLVATSTIIRFDHQNNEKVLMMPYINYDPYYTNYNIYRYTINRNNGSARNLVGLGSVDTSK